MVDAIPGLQGFSSQYGKEFVNPWTRRAGRDLPSPVARWPAVPIGFLVTVTAAALLTLLALAPQRRTRALRSLSFLSAAAFNELPFLVFASVMAATLLAVGQGDLRGRGGAACAGLAALTTALLATVAWRATRTARAVERALADGLGETWRAELQPGLAAGLRRHLPVGRILFLPLPLRPRGIERVADIRYGEGGERQSFDLYRRRAGPDGGRPVLVHLHGGGFRRGRKSRQSRPLLLRLAAQGWICISANYRLRPEVRLADQAGDVERVIAWVRANGHAYGVDQRLVFVCGTSAGAQLAAFAALTSDNAVAAAICLGGYYGPVDRSASLSAAVAGAGSSAPPFLVVHGELDTLVPAESARRFATALGRVSPSPVVYAQLPAGQHTFDLFHSIRFESVVDAIEAFAAWVRSRTP